MYIYIYMYMYMHISIDTCFVLPRTHQCGSGLGISICRPCAPVHELPISYCGDNWEGTLFS